MSKANITRGIMKADKIALVTAICSGILLSFAGCGESDSLKANKKLRAAARNEAEELPVAKDGIPRLVDLGRTFCIPCKMMAPILEELQKEYAGRLDVEFIDIGKNPEAAKKYRVRMIPTQIFLDASGKELYRHEGFFSKEDILKKCKELGVDVALKREK